MIVQTERNENVFSFAEVQPIFYKGKKIKIVSAIAAHKKRHKPMFFHLIVHYLLAASAYFHYFCHGVCPMGGA